MYSYRCLLLQMLLGAGVEAADAMALSRANAAEQERKRARLVDRAAGT